MINLCLKFNLSADFPHFYRSYKQEIMDLNYVLLIKSYFSETT